MTTPSPKPTTVRFAIVALASDADDQLPLDFSSLLRQSLVPGASVERHNKLWRVGPLIDVPGRPGSIGSRIGFEDSSTSNVWDHEAQDWTTIDTVEGTVYPFVLDFATGRLAYQASSSVRLLSAVQALLNSNPQGTRWRVQAVMVRQSWSEWRSSVRRVRRLRFRLVEPNPNFDGRPRIEEMLDGTRSKTADVVLTTDLDDLEGLDLESVFVKQAIAHSVEKGYGYLKAEGEVVVDGQPVERRFDSQVEGSEYIAQFPTPDIGGLTPGVLSAALDTVDEDPMIEAAPADDDDAPDPR